MPLPRRDASLSLVSEVDPFCCRFRQRRPLRSSERSRERALEVIRHTFDSVVDDYILIDSGIGEVLAQFNRPMSRNLTGQNCLHWLDRRS